jgi:hypothetical protein
MMLSTLLALALSVPAAKAADWPDLSTPLARTDEGRKDAVVLVAVEDYARLPDVPGAVASADAWLRWFVGVRGVPPSRVFKAYGAEVTPATLRELARQAAQAVQPGGTPWLVFIGRGDADAASGASTVLTQAAEPTPASVAEAGVTVASLVSALEANGQARAVALVDAAGCRPAPAGAAPEGLKGLRGHVLVSCGAEGVAPAVPGIVGPTFPYLALGAVGGWADVDGVGNRDGRVSASEVDEYVLGVLNLAVRGPRPTLLRMGTDLDVGKAVRAPAPDVLAMSLSAPAAPAGGRTQPSPPTSTGVTTSASPGSTTAPDPGSPQVASHRGGLRPTSVLMTVDGFAGTYGIAQGGGEEGGFPALRATWATGGARVGARVTWDRAWRPLLHARVGADVLSTTDLDEALCDRVARCDVKDSGWRDLGDAELRTDVTLRVGAGVSVSAAGWLLTPRATVGTSVRQARAYGWAAVEDDSAIVEVTDQDVLALALGVDVEASRRRMVLRLGLEDHIAGAGDLWISDFSLEAAYAVAPRKRVTAGLEHESRGLVFQDEGQAVLQTAQSFTRARLGMSFDL